MQILEESPSITEWVKVQEDTNIVFAGKDTVCCGTGNHLIFFNLANGQEHIYTANNKEKGDGISCYAGHRNVPVVAFAELVMNPRIMIMLYPDLVPIRIIKDGAPEGYSAMWFSEQTYLLTLSDIPQHELQIWNWRSMEKLCTIDTGYHYNRQTIRCSSRNPITIIQYGHLASDFMLWDIYNSYKQCIYIKHEILLPNKDKIIKALWSMDDIFYVLNRSACVYTLGPDYTLELIVYGGDVIGNATPSFVTHKGGLLVALTTMHIKFFLKTGDTWYEEWDVPPVSVSNIVMGRNYIVAFTRNCELLELDPNKHVFIPRTQWMTTTEQFCLIYPICNYFAAVGPKNLKEIKILEVMTANQVASIEITDGIICKIASNRVYPYITVGLHNGILVLISFLHVEKPCILTKFRLNKEAITDVFFHNDGDIIVTANMYHGLFFVITGIPGTQMQILQYIDYRRRTLDISISQDAKFINLYILVQTDPCLPLSQRVVVKCISKANPKLIKKKKYTSQDHKFSHFIVLNNGTFLAKLFNSKHICLLQFAKKSIRILREMHTGHYLRAYTIHRDLAHVFTYGWGGIIIIRSSDSKSIVASVMPHHRYLGGIKFAEVDPYLRFVLSYGEKTNELVCTRFLDVKDEHTGEELYFKVRTTLMGAPTIGFDLPIEYDENDQPRRPKTYLESLRAAEIEEEEKQFAKEREAIMNEFLILQQEVVELLNQNLNGPELEKIDILEFYQHTLLRQHKEEINKLECEWTVEYCKDLIRAQDEVYAFMKQKFYDSMVYKSSTIKGMYSKVVVESYGIAPGSAEFATRALQVTIYREIEDMLREGDLFRPWENASEEEVLEKLEKPPIIKFKSETARIKEALDEVELEESSGSEIKFEASVYPSNTVSEFIEQSKLIYNQDEMSSAVHCVFQRRLIQSDQEVIRRLFNTKFEELKSDKVKNMHTILERNERLRFILCELNIANIEIEDPKFYPSEDPVSVITVTEQEIGITPYISPSEQAKLDWEAAEAERIRLLLLADDFKERALIKMMDGVLEVRWEDTLKREIPKPKCMLEKQPELFNEEDLRAIKEYEEKVAFLHSERLRYKNMLETEYAKTAESVREIVKKFNSRLRELCMYKILVENARMQQIFIIKRIQIHFIRRKQFKRDELEIIENIKKNQILISETTEKLEEVGNAAITCRNVGEALHAKDKLIEKNFKREFQDLLAFVQEQTLKLFKKQPKLTIKGVSFISLINELANCVVTNEKSPILNQDCLDFLKSLDALDQYVNVPNAVDENMYKIICKHRRLRIENELRIKANALEQQDVEHAYQAFEKFLACRKDLDLNYIAQLSDKREEQLENVHNRRMQIVMKRGLVEVPMNGEISDFDNAILIHRQDIEDINERILIAGARKLDVMNEKMIHRREILIKEWEHKKMRMEIEDLKRHLYLVQNVKVTKEVQQYLRLRAKGESFDKGILTLDQEIEAQKKSYEKIMSERQSAINELQKQINDYKKKNKILDYQIAEINVDICEHQENRDLEFEKKYGDMLKNRMSVIVKRSNLVKQIQDQHNEIMVLQTELELLRLKTYPTLKYRTL